MTHIHIYLVISVVDPRTAVPGISVVDPRYVVPGISVVDPRYAVPGIIHVCPVLCSLRQMFVSSLR